MTSVFDLKRGQTECFLICSETEYQKMYRGHSSVQFCHGKSLIKSEILSGKITRYDERFLICSETEYQKMYRGHSSVQFCQGKSLIMTEILTGKITRYDRRFFSFDKYRVLLFTFLTILWIENLLNLYAVCLYRYHLKSRPLKQPFWDNCLLSFRDFQILFV